MVLPAASCPSTMLTVTRVSRIQGTPPIRSGSTVILSKAMPAWYAHGDATGRDAGAPSPAGFGGPPRRIGGTATLRP